MAFLQEEKLQAKDQKAADKSAVSRRPAIIGTIVIAAVIALVLAANSSKSEPEEDELGPYALEPDHAAAQQTLAQAEAAGAQTQEPAPSAPPAEELGVHEVPALNQKPASVSAYAAARQQLVDQHVLSVGQAALEARNDARNAPMRISTFRVNQRAELERAAALLGGGIGGSGGGFDGMPEGLPSMQQLASLSAAPALAALSGAAAAAPGAPAPQGGDPMLSANKAEFFRHGGDQLKPGRLEAEVQMPESEYELQMGAVIPGVLIGGINAEVPGQIIGQVSENVYDSATGRHLLIPQGSRLVGTYNATVANGQSRVQVAWTRMNFPDGRKLDLSGMPGTDQAGVSGFRDRINRHFWARLGAALMSSAFTVSYEVTAPQNGNPYGSAVHRGVGESIVQLGVDMARQEAQRPPTLEIRPGYRFSISVTKDIVFHSAYEDGIARRRERP